MSRPSRARARPAPPAGAGPGQLLLFEALRDLTGPPPGSRPDRLEPDLAAVVLAQAKGTGKRCPSCNRVKPRTLDAFYSNAGKPDGLSGICKVCVRLGMIKYRRTAKYRATEAEYSARPEVIERRRAQQRTRDTRAAEKAADRRTLRGRLMNARSGARHRLRLATDPARIAALEALIAQHDREIARIDAQAQRGIGS